MKSGHYGDLDRYKSELGVAWLHVDEAAVEQLKRGSMPRFEYHHAVARDLIFEDKEYEKRLPEYIKAKYHNHPWTSRHLADTDLCYSGDIGHKIDNFFENFLYDFPETLFVLHAGQSKADTFELSGISKVPKRFTRSYIETQVLFYDIFAKAAEPHPPNLGDCIHSCTNIRSTAPTQKSLALHNALTDAHRTLYVMLYHQAGLKRFEHILRKLSEREAKFK